MDYVFPALERKFKSDTQLRKLCRWLYYGAEEEIRQVKTYVEVVCDDADDTQRGFGFQDMVYTLTWRIFTKDARPEKCGAIMRHLHRVFHEQLLVSEHFETSGMEFLRSEGPKLVDNHQVGTMTMQLDVSLKTLLAATVEGAV